MAVVVNDSSKSQQFNILLIGNNPIELSSVYDRLLQLKDKKFIAEIAFDLKTAIKSKLKVKPSFILIDDNIGHAQVKKMVETFALNKNTRDVPITVLKNNNTGYSTEGVQEYILKNNSNGESLARALLNSLRFKRTQRMIYKTYYRGKRKLGKAIS